MLSYLLFYKYNILFYIFLLFTIYIFLTFIYIKLIYRFWSCQYIYNKYSIINNYYKNTIINNNKFTKNKFTNTIDIIGILSNDINENNYNNIVTLLNNNISNNNFITINNKELYGNNIKSYITEIILKQCVFNGGSYLSIYCNCNYNNNLYNLKDNNIYGLIISNNCYINFYRNKIKHLVNNIEFLCISYDCKYSNIDYQLFQTHLYYTSVKNKNIYIFKTKNIKNKYLIELFEFNNYLYDISVLKKKEKKEELNSLTIRKSLRTEKNENYHNDIFKVVSINKQNINLFINLFEECKFNFDISLLSNTQYILNKIIYKKLYIFVLLQYDEPLCAYCFENNYLTFNNNYIINCTSSLCNCISNDIFINGFFDALNILIEKYKFTYLYIDDLSHNYLLIKHISNTNQYIEKNNYNYYLYNYIYDTYKNSKVFSCL